MSVEGEEGYLVEPLFNADVIGMNMASEATLAKELGLRYANISSVDNYAHGIIVEGEARKQALSRISAYKARHTATYRLELSLYPLPPISFHSASDRRYFLRFPSIF